MRTLTYAASTLALTGMLLVSAPASAQGNSCWGQATAVFAQMGLMGEHASQQDEPRAGLGNLAQILFDMGVISEPTLAALGAYLADTLGLSIDRCMNDAGAV